MNFWEIAVIVLVAILVIKPERLPELAYLLGRFFGKLKSLQQLFINRY